MLVLNEKRVWSSCTGLFMQLVVSSVRVLPVAREGLWTSLPSLSCIANPSSGRGVGISANWLHLLLTPGYQLAEVVAFAMPPWQRSSTTAICWLPGPHFLNKHGLPMGNVTSHLWRMERKRPLQLLWDPWEPAGPLSSVKPLFYNGQNLSRSRISGKMYVLHF